jgi:hypothetical protein
VRFEEELSKEIEMKKNDQNSGANTATSEND